LEQAGRHNAEKKTALIRSLLRSIEAALRSGHTMKDVWHTLAEQA